MHTEKTENILDYIVHLLTVFSLTLGTSITYINTNWQFFMVLISAFTAITSYIRRNRLDKDRKNREGKRERKEDIGDTE